LGIPTISSVVNDDIDDINSLVPVDSTPDDHHDQQQQQENSLSASYVVTTGSSSSSNAPSDRVEAIVEAHIVSDNSLTYEERVAAEVEARLQEEMRRKLGSIATAEVIRLDDSEPTAFLNGSQQQQEQQSQHINHPAAVPIHPPTPDQVHIDEPNFNDHSINQGHSSQIQSSQNQIKESAGASLSNVNQVRKKMNRWMLWIGIIVLVVMAAAGGAIAGIILERSRDDETDVPTVSPSALRPPSFPIMPTVPTVSPDEVSPTHSNRYNSMKQSLLQVSKPENLDDESSPQHSAFIWLTFEDGIQLESTPSFELFQRYVIAVLYFAMDGRRWKQQLRFLSATHVCDWNVESLGMGIFCQNETQVVQLIDLSSNGLRGGPIPSEIEYLEKLEQLVLMNNDIDGRIPASISRLKYLKYLDLDRNLFSSSLPSELSTMTNLQYFYAASNRLTGSIPDMKLLLNLIHISLDDNRLTRLPIFPTGSSEGGVPPQMQLLSFSMNRLTGTIGDSICNQQELVAFNVYSNELSGEIPECMGNLGNLGKFLFGCHK
jgi:hypothetical protein